MKHMYASNLHTALDEEIEQLLHPAKVFHHPRCVVADPDLTLNEKRAILASWASDACALEAMPALRQAPGTPHPVGFDEVMEALRALDREAAGQYRASSQASVGGNPRVVKRKNRHQNSGGERRSLN